MDIFRDFINAGENCIAISSNREIRNKTHGPHIKPSGWNRNRIQQPMRSSSEVLAPLAHATTFDEPFHIGDYTSLLHMMNNSSKGLTKAQVARKVTAIKLSK